MASSPRQNHPLKFVKYQHQILSQYHCLTWVEPGVDIKLMSILLQDFWLLLHDGQMLIVIKYCEILPVPSIFFPETVAASFVFLLCISLVLPAHSTIIRLLTSSWFYFFFALQFKDKEYTDSIAICSVK